MKYEDIYLKGYADMGELTLGLTDYFAFYNGERPHQALANRTPDQVYASGQGGGATVVDKFRKQANRETEALSAAGGRADRHGLELISVSLRETDLP